MRFASLALLVTGCVGATSDEGDHHPGDETVTTGDGPAAPDEPSIDVVAPEDSSGIYATTTLRWAVTNFTLDEGAIGEEDVEGRGHVHVYLDGVLQAETGATEMPVAMTDGEHTLEVRLSRNDHTELPYADGVGVQALNPTISLTAPSNAAELPGSSTEMGVLVTDFALDLTSTEPHFGEGYYALYVDGEPTTIGADPTTAAVTRIPEGPHTVQAELLHADGRPLVPPVTSNLVDVNVLAGSPYVEMDSSLYDDGELRSASALVNLTTANFQLGPNSAGYDVYVDGTFYLDGNESSFLLTHLPPGRHMVEAQLTGAGDVRDIMPVVIAEARPDVTIASPGDSGGVRGAFAVTVTTENFTLNPSFPCTNVEGEGHIQISVDGTLVASSGTVNTTLTDVESGDHLLRVELVNNDETPLAPPVMDQIRVRVSR